MDDPLRNALVVKMGNFFAQDKIFQQRWAAFARAQRVLVVCDAYALIGGERKILAAFTLFFMASSFSLCVSGAFILPGAVGSSPGAVGCGVGRQFWSSGAKASRPGFASRSS